MSRKFGRNKYADSLCSLYLLLIASLCICSCTSENNIVDNNDSKLLNFSVSVPEWKNNDSISNSRTRATPISGTSLGTSSSFNIIADVYDGTKNYSTIIKDEAVSYTNNMWKTTAPHYWPGTTNNTVNFYAYYPTTISSNITHTAGSAPTLSYTVPDDVASQIDIMTATRNNVSGSTNSSTPLSFNHIFAAIQFSVGSNGLGSGTISSISIGNVYNSGTYNWGTGWTLGTSMKTFTIIQPKNISGTSGEDIYSGTYTLMMIPQTVTNATITINYSNGGTLTKTIYGTWEAGKTYNYKISFIREYNYTGNVQSFTAPISGIYKLEVWGAQGGSTNAINNGGKGGLSYGNIKMDKGSIIYLWVGGVGIISSSIGGYNGGGASGNTGASGGGATHISITNRGILANYVNYQDEVLIVAGGGGASDPSNGGDGGGNIGGTGTTYDGGDGSIGTGGNQNTCGGPSLGGFGLGGAATSTPDHGAGGGGGWYGGGGTTYAAGGGGGGSGHLGSNLISGTTGMSNGIRSGNGYARITFVSAN